MESGGGKNVNVGQEEERKAPTRSLLEKRKAVLGGTGPGKKDRNAESTFHREKKVIALLQEKKRNCYPGGRTRAARIAWGRR